MNSKSKLLACMVIGRVESSACARTGDEVPHVEDISGSSGKLAVSLTTSTRALYIKLPYQTRLQGVQIF